MLQYEHTLKYAHMKTIKIAILDCIGLHYDGTTLTKRGIGGSESSIISIAPELVLLGFDVSIFNDCATDETSPGIYDGVTYRPISALGLEDFEFDIVISQRTVIPFTPEYLYDQVRQPAPRDYDPTWFTQLQRPTQLKILWQQDTFIWGDHILEELIVNKHVDEIFNISDWHIAYTANSTHGPRRNFEVLKGHFFNTRNAINRWIDWVDIKAKDPDLFVYNASITKGMEPLVRDIWPKIKSQWPQAKLKIIGGYYNFRSETVSEAEAKVIALQDLTKDDPSIEFTGIIPQPEIAEIMANASYNLYPGAYPETSGISTIESINYNTPIIGVRFGAMEESATTAAGYFINYAIEPNGLFPWINQSHQVARYVSLVSKVLNDPYLHQQKQYACDAVKDVSTWDTVALQWKQHFYNRLGLELADDEQQQVAWINYRVRKVFGRRIANTEDIIQSQAIVDHAPLPQPRLKIAYIDIVGMAYDGDALNRRGLGGSESAVILSACEMAKLGFDVTVFNACDEDDNKPGVYDYVQYRPLSELGTDTYDVVISSRIVTPFITENFYDYPQTTNRKVDYAVFKDIREKAKLRVFWMHDTFCWGDDILEDLVVCGAIDEIWTLSDFHTMYVMNCSHPRMRNYEVLRNRVWTTRNGIVKYFNSVDIDSKDPNMYIFNANMSKGLAPLLNDVWPRVKVKLPDARLTVIGGHYKLGAAFAHDDEESEFMKIAGAHLDDATITFTGIIKQSQVADLSAKASYFIYPTALPETYSISALESLYANTPLLTCRFGALEETASRHSYYIDYASVPNGLFPNINAQSQADLFADMVVAAYNDPVEHRARMQALDEVKDLAGWDVTALEWKHHIYSKLGRYMSADESRQVRYTKAKYHQVFGRRYTAPEDVLAPKQTVEQKIVVVSPFFNAQDYIEQCIASVAAQDYDNYEHWLIDDASIDSTLATAKDYIANLPDNIQGKFKLICNSENQGAGYNYVQAIRGQRADTIVLMLDGDDSLINRPDIFDYYNKLHLDYDFTYGSCWSLVDNIPLQAQTYPPSVKAAKSYKDHKFNWNLPYTHLRTLKAKLLQHVSDSNFQDASGNWFKAGNDLAIFYSAIESADPSRVYAVPDIVYNYNDASPTNDYKINRTEQDRTIAAVLNKDDRKYSVVVPTMWRANDLFLPFLTRLCSLDVVDEIIIINNDNTNTPAQGLTHPKIKMHDFGQNIYVNPAWNFGVQASNNDRVCILNDDVVFDVDLFERLKDYLTPDNGVFGLCPGDPIWNQPPITNRSIDIIPWTGQHTLGFGSLMFINKINWVDIPESLLIYYGDNFIFDNNIRYGRSNYLITNMYFETPMAATTSDTSITGGFLDKETPIYEKIKSEMQAPKKMKRILIAIPTNRNIEAQTFKSIYDLITPRGCIVEFQYFWGYQVDQVRNLIADWTMRNGFDYLFCVDSDIAFTPDTLVKLIAHDRDIVSGVYIQRIPGTHTIEIMRKNIHGGVSHVDWADIKDQGLVPIDGCGFGCVLIKTEVLQAIPYPHFLYHSAIDHANTISEDVHFCNQARDRGFALWCDTSILCEHIGSWSFNIDNNIPARVIETPAVVETPEQTKLRQLGAQDLLPQHHFNYLLRMRDEMNVKPRVIYDIGACVLHWTNRARMVWPDADYTVFEAMEASEFLFQEAGLKYNIGLLSKDDGTEVSFYENTEHPGGNSYYRENEEFSPAAAVLFDESHRKVKLTNSLDAIVARKGFPAPDFIKMDVQGAELDVLLGAQNTLKGVQTLILELQHVRYNTGAPLRDEVIAYLDTIGFRLITPLFCNNGGGDGDYHFARYKYI